MSTFSERLRQIREKSDLILASSERDQAPTINRTWDQLTREMKSMGERIPHSQELHAKAHYFLASNGIDTEYVTAPIDTSHTFARIEVEDDTNIKEFLDEEHEKALIRNIEANRQQTNRDFQAFYNQQFEEIFQNIEAERKEEANNSVDYEEFAKSNSASGINRINEYAGIVTSLNNTRTQDLDYDLIQNLSSIRNMSELKKAQDCTLETWNIIQHLVDQSNVPGRKEGRFIKTYASEPYQTFPAVETRRALISTSKSWLEQQSHQFVNDTLNRHAQTIKIGGNPLFNHRLRAFMNLTFKTNSGWSDDRLEVVENLPIWAFVFYLMRCGHLDMAAEFVDTHREMFATERKFVSYFEEYVNAEYHTVSPATKKAILADYNKFEYGEHAVDPYKLILYKIMGRCELHKKSQPDIIRTVEDFIWLQLTMVREVAVVQEPNALERYSLADVQKHVASYGNSYFDPDNTNPWIYFRILILTLQFEQAIGFLHKDKKYRLETVHFAIALVYHGLLRVLPASRHDTKIMLITENAEHQVFYLNFYHLIYHYIQVFIPDSRQNAVQYLYLLSLYSSGNGYLDQSMVYLARSYVCKYVIDSNDAKTLLGTFNDEQRPALIERQKSLLYVRSREEFTKVILHPTAEQCIQRGRCSDAVHIYSVAQDYNKVVDVLVKELTDALQQSHADRVIDLTLSDEPNEAIIQFTKEAMDCYSKFEPFTKVVTAERQNTIRILTHLLQFRTFYDQKEFDMAMQHLESTDIIPLRYDHQYILRLAELFNLLDDSIKKNVPEILLNTMDILYKTWVSFLNRPTESSNYAKIAQGVLMFAGLIKYNIPTDILIRLNKAVVAMTKGR
ncbi:NIC-domain-containing protein [Mucor ambiguus]|uniref:Nuclear pore protein n=1 Tax=Mucor ambiguus TaxID=91626 RepID=A0A0C9MQV7_9FUNG|nr:NIC-domain-containing protein [Mucor ambiguus]